MKIKNLKIKNLSPHPIVLLGVEIPPSGVVARCEEKVEEIDRFEWDGKTIPVIKKTLGEVVNLPEPEEDTIFIVSLLVAEAVKKQFPDRKDIFVVGETVRDSSGKIIGAISLAKV
jgi:hypothetical protein